MIRLIVGLGNPGSQYEKTRHNAGFAFLDELADRFGIVWQKQSQFEGAFADGSINGQRMVFLKPMTYMNRSGSSVGKVLRYYKYAPEDMLVVHDELELPEGVGRLKQGGGHSGHNGLRDIIAQIDSRDFLRLRVGVGRPVAGGNVADYVLSRASHAGQIAQEMLFEQVIDQLDAVFSREIDKVNRALEMGK